VKRDNLERLVVIGVDAALKAGEEILEVYAMDDFGLEIKQDKSPLTLADKRSNTKIEGILKSTGIPILSEEGGEYSFKERKQWKELWVVDPLDGTKEFVKKNGEFTVNIALVQNNKPILGIIYVPVKKNLYFAAKGCGAYKIDEIIKIDEFSEYKDLISKAIKLPSVKNKKEFVVVGSRSHMSEKTQEFINCLAQAHEKIQIVSAGSAIKLCLVAEGKADVYPRFAPTMEWDTAAGHAIANESGKRLTVYPSGYDLEYNRENLVNPWFLVQE